MPTPKFRRSTTRRPEIVPRPEISKALGAVVGLAVCEALAHAEAMPQPTDALSSPDWGDGTSMTLALAESLIDSGGINQRDLLVRYTSWFRYGHLSSTETCTFIDDAVKDATLRFERTWHPEDTDQRQGDVCLTRISPAVIYFFPALEQALDACAQVTRTTHSGQESVDAAVLLGAMLHTALDSDDPHRVIRPDAALTLSPAAEQVRAGRKPDGSNPACSSLAVAVQALAVNSSFADGCLACRPAGPRAMAAYGQLAGACFGLEAIPEPWRNSLAKPQLLHELTLRLIHT